MFTAKKVNDVYDVSRTRQFSITRGTANKKCVCVYDFCDICDIYEVCDVYDSQCSCSGDYEVWEVYNLYEDYEVYNVYNLPISNDFMID
ncbi:hypothetical protein L3Y34_017721 [Caenorhabditis briggsae]|uniref:Uncharacterized protein n=1 Tax=Caenorhabditis briggsae TaxID=6238 RepID=A0AAE9DI92_CAEBR|nr:hypothetical protein L3Y34_017721 [Caenorhabditis briggsae]